MACLSHLKHKGTKGILCIKVEHKRAKKSTISTRIITTAAIDQMQVNAIRGSR